MSFLHAAQTVLAAAGEPLHYKEITERALAQNLVATKGATPWDTMNAQISTHIKRKGEASPFMRTKPGVFALSALGLDREREPDLKARVAHLPAWAALRGFLQAVDRRPREELTLYRWSAQRGTIITTSGFSKGARDAAFDIGAAPIQLIDGDTLVDLLVDHGIGVKQQAVKLWRFDAEPFRSRARSQRRTMTMGMKAHEGRHGDRLGKQHMRSTRRSGAT